MNLPLIRLGETLELLERLKGDVEITPPLRYKICSVYAVLRSTSEMVAPLLSGEWEKDSWLEHENSLDFTGLSHKDLEGLPDMTPGELRTILRITTG